MGATGFNEMERDAIGEIMNISLGASATAISTMLGTKVNITTPTVRVQTKEEFEFKKLEPAVGVEIAYTEGLEGKNIMMFRRNDVRIIVGMMMGAEMSEEEFELDEINLSAICEVMNQMMGSSATALSEFLGTTVNISTPQSFDITDEDTFKDQYFTEDGEMVIVRFLLEIEGKLESEFLNIMSMNLARRLLAPFASTLETSAPSEQAAPAKEEPDSSAKEPEQPAPVKEEEPAPETTEAPKTEIPAPAAETNGPQPAPEIPPVQSAAPTPVVQEAQSAPPVQQPVYGQPLQQPAYGQPQPFYGYSPAGDPMMAQILQQMQQTQAQMAEMMREIKKPEAKSQSRQSSGSNLIRPLSPVQMDEGVGNCVEETANQEMLMQVPLEVSVEIGRTKKLVRDILEFTQGSLVVLDKMAGEQVDLYVNGQCIAKGDIVVVEDNFGIRITEIISRNIHQESL